MKLTFWRSRYTLDTPIGQRASFLVDKDLIEDIDFEAGVVTITHKDYIVVVFGEGFGWTKREKKATRGKKGEQPSAEGGAS